MVDEKDVHNGVKTLAKGAFNPACFAYLRTGQTIMPHHIDALLNRKPVMILSAIAVVCFSVYCIVDFGSMARRSHAQALLTEMNAIMRDVEKLPSGIPRGEQLVRKLKALDPGLAPAEVKQALRDYTDALDSSIQAMKAGRDATRYDAPMAEARQRLADCFRKYR
jgi:hypothetical protein